MPELVKRHYLHLQVTLPCFRMLSTRKLNKYIVKPPSQTASQEKANKAVKKAAMKEISHGDSLSTTVGLIG